MASKHALDLGALVSFGQIEAAALLDNGDLGVGVLQRY